MTIPTIHPNFRYLVFTFLFLFSICEAQVPGLAWARNFEGSDSDEGKAVVTDGAGNVYVAGYFYGTIDFDPGTGITSATSAGESDGYIAKFDANGNLLWAKVIAGLDIESPTAMTIDLTGNLYITGTFTGTPDFDPNAAGVATLTAADYDVFILKLDGNGNFVWVRQLGGAEYDAGSGISVDASSNVYTTGTFLGTSDFDPGALSFDLIAAGQLDIFISKLNSNGDFVWAKSIGGVDYEESYSIALDGSQNVFITGYFTTTTDFDPGAASADLVPAGAYDVFILKLDGTGAFVWAKGLGGAGAYTFGSAIKTDVVGNVYVTGNFEGTVDFDPGPSSFDLVSAAADVFAVKLANNGNLIYAKGFGGSGYDFASAMTVDGSQNVFLTGYFEDLADFDPGAPVFSLTSRGSSDIFISKLSQTGAFVWAGQMGGTGGEYSNSIYVDGSGNIYATGSFDGTSDFDPSPCNYALTSSSTISFVEKILPNPSGSPCLIITLQPVSVTGCPGQTVNFTTAATGTTNILYQWQIFNPGTSVYDDVSDGGGYTGTTTSTLSINTTGNFGEGDYRCKISGDLVSDIFSDIGNLTLGGVAAPSTAGNTRCGTGVVVLNAAGAIDGQYRWYDVPSGGTAIAGEVNNIFTTPPIAVTTTYYVSIDNGVCESLRTDVVATVIVGGGTPPTTTDAAGCGAGIYLLSASGTTNGNYRWYTASTGGTAIAGAVNGSYTTPSISITTTYYVSISFGGCESSRTPVTATINICTPPPGVAWVNPFGSTNTETGNAITTDASGNTYTTGYFSGTIDFDPGPGTSMLTGAGSRDIFIIKLDPAGNLVWVKGIGNIGQDNGSSIDIDASGNVLVTGFFEATVDFDPGPGTTNLASAGTQDIFVLKLDGNGNFVWARRMGAANTDRGFGIITDAAGNVYTTGYFLATVDFDPGAGTQNLTAPGSFHQVFISKLNPSGNYVWAGMVGGTASDWGNSIALDPIGNILVTGLFGSTSDFDPGPGVFNLSYAGSFDAFVLKLDGNGAFMWAKRLGANGARDEGFSVVCDAAQNVYTTGTFNGTVDFDPGVAVSNLISAGREDVYVSKLDPTGNFVWAKRMGGTSFDFSNSIQLDGSGNIFTTGWFDATADFDPGSAPYELTSGGDYDIFISKLDNNGDFIWAVNMGGILQDRSLSLALDASGSIYTTGYFNDTADFDPGICTSNLTSAGSLDAFIHKLSPAVASLCIDVQPIASGVCNGTNAQFTVNAIGTSGITYQWQKFNTATSLFADIVNGSGYTGTTTAALNVATLGNFGAGDYRCKVSGNQATDKFSSAATLTINTTAAPAVSGVSSCTPKSLILTAVGGVAGQYRWYTTATGGTSISGETSSTYTTPVLSLTTNYYVSIDNGICESARTLVTVTINSAPTKPIVSSSITASGGNVSVCSSNVLTLTAPAGFSSYAWSNGATTQQVVASVSGPYSVMVTNASGCVSLLSDVLTVTVLPAPCNNQPPVITPASAATQIGGVALLDLNSLITDADNNIDIQSLKIKIPPGSGAKATLSTGGILEVDYTGISFSGTDQLTIEVCDLLGDCAQQLITIEVIGDLIVYNAVSPNGDGKNDAWIIQYIDIIQETKTNKVAVYNRWGDSVFEVDNYDNVNRVFTGHNKSGNELPPGTYFYKIEFTSGRKTQTGYLSLKR